jgi:hypothetical protein
MPSMRGPAIGFWIFSGFLIGLATSVGARILLCPQVEESRAKQLPAVVPAVVQKPTAAVADAPSLEPAVLQRMQAARSILSAVAQGDGRWTSSHRQALQREVALLPEREAHEIVHEMVDAIHSGKLRPE